MIQDDASRKIEGSALPAGTLTPGRRMVTPVPTSTALRMIVRVRLPNRFSDYAAGTGKIIGAEGYRLVGHLVDDMSLPVDPHIRPRIQMGRGMSADGGDPAGEGGSVRDGASPL